MSKFTDQQKEYIEKSIEAGNTKQSIIEELNTSYYYLNKYLDNKVDVVEKDKSPVVIQQVKSTEEKLGPRIQTKLLEEYSRIKNNPENTMSDQWINNKYRFSAYLHRDVIEFYKLFKHLHFQVVSTEGNLYRLGSVKLIKVDNE